jgi:hypothetical protein
LDAYKGKIRASVNLAEPTFGFIRYGPYLIVDISGSEGEAILREPFFFNVTGRLKMDIEPTKGFMVDGKLIARTDDGRVVCFLMPEI